MKSNYYLKRGLIACAVTLFSLNLNAQVSFTESASSLNLDIGGSKDGGFAWYDYDNDGDLDVLVNTGLNGGSLRSYLMRNDGTTFTDVSSSLAPGLIANERERQAIWGDLNNDGYVDFLRNTGGSQPSQIEIYLQDPTTGVFGNGTGGTSPITAGNGSSDDISISGGVNTEGVGFFDFDGDGDLDIYIDNHNYGIDLLRNNFINHTTGVKVNPSSTSLFTHITTGSGVSHGLNQSSTDGDYGASADVNDDGWIDIFMRKRDQNDFFLNKGNVFINGQDLAQANNGNKGSVGLYDLDNDGDYDAVWTDNDGNFVWENDNGTWVKLNNKLSIQTSTDIDGVAGGDIDNDGDIDLIFTGGSKSYLYINDINNSSGVNAGTPFKFDLSTTFDSYSNNSGNGEGIVMIDFDGDGDLDIYENKNGSGNKLWINNLYTSSTLQGLKEFIEIQVYERRSNIMQTGAKRFATGTNILLKECDGTVISGIRDINGGTGHGTQTDQSVHFGLPYGNNKNYIIEVRFPRDSNYSAGTSNRLVIQKAFNPYLDRKNVILFHSSDPDSSCAFLQTNIDPDKDGIPTWAEICGPSATDYSCLNSILDDGTGTGIDPSADFDNDGVPNYIDANDPGVDHNGNCLDLNSDGRCDDIHPIFDTDGDGVPNFYDLDADNDGIPDIIEAGGTDTDGNGKVDNLADTDLDGLVDVYDTDDTDGPGGTSPCSSLPGCVVGSTSTSLFDQDGNGTNEELNDTDKDEIPNFLDLDADNDGIPDAVEAGGTDINGDGRADNYVDNDFDGFNDVVDGDVGNDGISENSSNALQVSGPDTNGDGLPDSYPSGDTDGDGILDQLDLDVDNDGIPDVVEAGGTDANGDGRADNFADADKDGFNDVVDGDPTNVLTVGSDLVGANTPNALQTTGPDTDADGAPNSFPNGDTDGDGILDQLDLDADNDGIPDVVEAGGTDVNGDGRADNFADADEDGFNDVVDGDPTNNLSPGTDTNGANSSDALQLTGADTNGDGAPNSYPSGDTDNDGVLDQIDLDADNDGIPDVVEAGGTDVNGDGRADNFVDADNDGFNDVVDGDPTNTLATGNDTNGANSSDALQLTGADTNGNGAPNSYPSGDSDKDGILDQLDLDVDNDGIPDVVEAGGTDANGDGRADNFVDADNDGFNDVVDGDPTNALATGTDTNGANSSDALQLTGADTNGDGAPNSFPSGDTDKDGILDQLDLDADNDGIPDAVEAGGTDVNGDGRADNFADADNDGFNDTVDGDPSNSIAAGTDSNGTNTSNALQLTGADTNGDGIPNSFPSGDTDGDGKLDQIDLDADNDGIPDVVEAGGTDANGDGRADNFTDSDKDGFNDVVDGDPSNALAKGNDNNGSNSSNALQLTGTDTNGDGAPNSYPSGDADGDGILNQLDSDADNDGVLDVLEAGGKDGNIDGEVDNGTPVGTQTDNDADGFVDDVDGDPTNSLNAGDDSNGTNSANALIKTSTDPNGDGTPTNYPNANFDMDAVPNFLDKDSDNDGILDTREAQGNTCYVAPTNTVNARGLSTVFVSYSNCVDNFNATTYGVVPSIDNDDFKDTDPDYLDFDSDADSAADFEEGFDFNINKYSGDDYKLMALLYEIRNLFPGHYSILNLDNDSFPDWLDNTIGFGYDSSKLPPFQDPTSSFYRDTDNDGVVDLFDSDNGGVDQTMARPDNDGDGDYDWRSISFVQLPVELLDFQANLVESDALLTWKTATEINNEKFEIFRRFDNEVEFTKIGEVKGAGNSNEINSYQYIDPLAYANAQHVFYKLVQVDYNGHSKESEIRVVTLSNENNGIVVYPVPTSEALNIKTNSLNVSNYIITNSFGQVIEQGTITDGDQINTSTYTKGIYFIEISIDSNSSRRVKFIVD